MAMTRKHYREVAEVFRAQYDYYQNEKSMSDDAAGTAQDALRYVASALATLFAIDNPNFDRARFYRAACGVDE